MAMVGSKQQGRPVSSGDSRNRNRQPDDAGKGDDFGSRVHSTLRSSADLFNLPPKDEPASARRRTTDGETPVAESEGDQTATSTSRERPSRYWRDSLSSPLVTDVEDDSYDDDDGGDGGGNGGIFGDGGPSRRALIAAAAIVLAAIIAILLFQMLGDDDNGGDDATPTATTQPVIGTVPADDATDEPETDPTQSSRPTSQPTQEVRQGGDNQLGEGDDEPEEDGDSTPEP